MAPRWTGLGDRSVAGVSAPEPPMDPLAAARVVGPRGIRVSLAPSLAHAGLPAIVVETAPPSGHPLRPGGAVVDGQPIAAMIGGLDPGRAILRLDATVAAAIRPSATHDLPEAATRLLFEPVEPIADGRGAFRREVIVDGWRVEVELESERHAALRDRARRGHASVGGGEPTEIHAIIPGRIVSVSVQAGESVVIGQQLFVVEAMKMQNELRAPRDGTVERIAVVPGQTVEIGDLLVVVE
jgi:biotin carboxyl carrier protein